MKKQRQTSASKVSASKASARKAGKRACPRAQPPTAGRGDDLAAIEQKTRAPGAITAAPPLLHPGHTDAWRWHQLPQDGRGAPGQRRKGPPPLAAKPAIRPSGPAGARTVAVASKLSPALQIKLAAPTRVVQPIVPWQPRTGLTVVAALFLPAFFTAALMLALEPRLDPPGTAVVASAGRPFVAAPLRLSRARVPLTPPDRGVQTQLAAVTTVLAREMMPPPAPPVAAIPDVSTAVATSIPVPGAPFAAPIAQIPPATPEVARAVPPEPTARVCSAPPSLRIARDVHGPVPPLNPDATLAADPQRFGKALAAAAIAQSHDLVIYNANYMSIAYPRGDVPALYGVCTDVVIRAYRALDIDLQELVHQARAGGPSDPNIDHRRTELLRRFFASHGEQLAVTGDVEDYLPGDIVTYYRPQNRSSTSHIAVVTGEIAPSGRPMIAHNRGWGVQLEDALFVDQMTGHYRFRGLNATAVASLSHPAARAANKPITATARLTRISDVRPSIAAAPPLRPPMGLGLRPGTRPGFGKAH